MFKVSSALKEHRFYHVSLPSGYILERYFKNDNDYYLYVPLAPKRGFKSIQKSLLTDLISEVENIPNFPSEIIERLKKVSF